MKTFRLGIFVVIAMGLLPGIEATAGNRVGLPDNEARSEQMTYINSEKDFHGSKVIRLDSSGKHGLETKTADEPNAMTWDAAVLAVKSLGDGWRLPTIVELRTMYEQRKSIGGFADEDYWSSTEQDVNSAWIQGFRLGDQDRYNKQSRLNVRAVRPF